MAKLSDAVDCMDPDNVPMPGPMPPPPPPPTGAGEILVSFESGHYKKVKGSWKGDSVWCHINKDAGGQVHINKDKVEYIETF